MVTQSFKRQNIWLSPNWTECRAKNKQVVRYLFLALPWVYFSDVNNIDGKKSRFELEREREREREIKKVGYYRPEMFSWFLHGSCSTRFGDSDERRRHKYMVMVYSTCSFYCFISVFLIRCVKY
jgi:hypothetical protein